MSTRIIGFTLIDMTSDPAFPRGHVVVSRPTRDREWWDLALTDEMPITCVPAAVEMAIDLEKRGG